MKTTAMELRRESLLSIGLCALGLLLAAGSISAETIASVANPNPNLNSAGILTSVDEANEVSWSSANAYHDVSISASFGKTTYYENATGIAYLMTQIGPGSTTAAQIAVANFTFPNSTGGTVELFQNLSLGPGSYFLVLYSTDPVGGGWLVSNDSTETTAPGVAIGGSGYFYDPGTLKGPFFPYPPDVPFVAYPPNEEFVFDIEGTAPEPSSIGFLAVAGLLAGFMKVRGRRARLAR